MASNSYIVRYIDHTFDCHVLSDEDYVGLIETVAGSGTRFAKITPYYGLWNRSEIDQYWREPVDSPAEEE